MNYVQCRIKALGALRTAVADNEYLRDALRISEDSRNQKIKSASSLRYINIFVNVFWDIIKTDDPIDAIGANGN